MEWIKSLSDFNWLELAIILTIVVILNLKNIIDGIKKMKDLKASGDTKIIINEPSPYEKMMYEGEKVLNDCMAIIVDNTPVAFNENQKEMLKLILFKSFSGSCLQHIRGLASRNGFADMTEARFAEYCREEAPRVMRAVTDSVSLEWQGKEDFFPMTRAEYREHNYNNCARDCGEKITSWFIFCRNIKMQEKEARNENSK